MFFLTISQYLSLSLFPYIYGILFLPLVALRISFCIIRFQDFDYDVPIVVFFEVCRYLESVNS